MDERIKSLRTLHETRLTLVKKRDGLLTRLGAAMLERLGATMPEHPGAAMAERLGAATPERQDAPDCGGGLTALVREANGLEHKIAETSEKITLMEADMDRLNWLESAILSQKRAAALALREAEPLYRALGESALRANEEAAAGAGAAGTGGAAEAAGAGAADGGAADSGGAADTGGAGTDAADGGGGAAVDIGGAGADAARARTEAELAAGRQARLLEARIQAARKRVEDSAYVRGGFFAFAGAWLFKTRETALIKKTQAELTKLRVELGRSLAACGCGAYETSAKAAEVYERLRVLENDISEKKNEVAALAAKWKSEGGRGAKLQILKKGRELLEKDFADVRIKAGREVSDVSKKEIYNPLLHSEDLLTIEYIRNEQAMLDEADDKIRKLEASLEIDIKQAQVEKLEKQIANKRVQIAKLDDEITGIESRVFNINKEIIRLGEGN